MSVFIHGRVSVSTAPRLGFPVLSHKDARKPYLPDIAVEKKFRNLVRLTPKQAHIKLEATKDKT